MTSLADQVDLVIGVDTHKHTHTAAVVNAATGGKVAELTVATDPDGYDELLRWADQHGPSRVWSVEGAGGYGAGLTRHLTGAGERVVELDRPVRAARRHGAKSDPLDAVRAAREALGRPDLGARRAHSLMDEAREHERAITAIVRAWRPDLLDQPGVGPIVAAQVLTAWSHPGQVRSEAAFAMLSGTAPIPASSGLRARHRLNRSGDRQLNRALHVVALTRTVHHQQTRDYIERRRAEGRTDREIRRCLKRYIARRLYRQLQHGLLPA